MSYGAAMLAVCLALAFILICLVILFFWAESYTKDGYKRDPGLKDALAILIPLVSIVLACMIFFGIV